MHVPFLLDDSSIGATTITVLSCSSCPVLVKGLTGTSNFFCITFKQSTGHKVSVITCVRK